MSEPDLDCNSTHVIYSADDSSKTTLAAISPCMSGGENDARQGYHTNEPLKPHVYLRSCERLPCDARGVCSEMHEVCVGILDALTTSD